MKTLPLVATIFACGCGATVHSSLSPNTNVSRYRTYAFYNSPYKQGKPETLADQQIRAALAQNLNAKGLTEAPAAPDFEVSYHVVLQERMSPSAVGYGYWGYGPMDMSTYTQGTLVVDFVDPRTNKVFWRGTASQIVNDPMHVDMEKLDKAVAKLVDQYPYNVAGASRPAM